MELQQVLDTRSKFKKKKKKDNCISTYQKQKKNEIFSNMFFTIFLKSVGINQMKEVHGLDEGQIVK